MKHLNFLSKSSSQSCGHSSVTLASTVGSPSVHRRSTMLKLISVLVLIFTIGVGQMWANYTITFKTSGSSSDGSDAQTTIANLISDGGGYVNSISASRAYNGKNGTGVKLGYGRGGGNVEMTMKSSGTNIGQIKATKLVVTATQYSNTENNLKVTVTYTTGSTPTEETLTLSSTSTPYDVTLDATKTIQKIKIETNSTKKRAYCASIQVVEASSKTLSSISVSTAPKVKYVAGENFDPTGLKITATYSDASKEDISYAAATFTLSPTTSTALTTSHTSVSITYGGKSTSQSINVYSVDLQARDEDGNAIAAGGPGEPTRSGTTITAAADAGNYVFKQWNVTNASVAASETNPTTISDPTDAVTVTAVYYKPIPISWNKNGSLLATTYTGYNQKPVFPEEPSSCDATSDTFYGWATSTWDDPIDNLGGKTVYTSADDMPAVTAAGTVYNAVFAKKTTVGGGASSAVGLPVQFTTSNYSSGVTTSAGTATISASKTINSFTAGLAIQQTQTNAYWLFTIPVTNFSANDSVTIIMTGVKVNNNSYKHTYQCQYSTNGSSYTDFGDSFQESTTATTITRGVKIGTAVNSGNIYIKVLATAGGASNAGSHYIGSTVDIKVNSTSSTTYSRYLTNCCTSLGSIKGSINLSHF